MSLPTWKANVGYEEGEEWVLSKMKCGYPRYDLDPLGLQFPAMLTIDDRFFIHNCITAFADVIRDHHGRSGEAAMLFPSHRVASRCLAFLCAQEQCLGSHNVRILELVPDPQKDTDGTIKTLSPSICAVIYPEEYFGLAKIFWQHSGDGVSSRRAEFAHRAYDERHLMVKKAPGRPEDGRMCRGPKRYQRSSASEKGESTITNHDLPSKCKAAGAGLNGKVDGREEYVQFIEERFGRNLETSFVSNAKMAVRRRIVGSLTAEVDLDEAVVLSDDSETARNVNGFSVEDVYLHPSGMSSIFNTHQTMMEARGPKKSICFG